MTSTGLRETETLILEGTKKILLAPTPRGKQQWPNRWLNQNYLLVLDGLLWRRGLAGAHHRDQGPGSIRLGRSPLQFTINVTTDPTGTRSQSASIHWVIEETREFSKNIYFCFIDYFKAFDCVYHNKLWKILNRWEYQSTWPASWEICMQVRMQQLVFTRRTFVGKVMSLLFNKSSLLINCLPRSKCLLISWLSHNLQWFWNLQK